MDWEEMLEKYIDSEKIRYVVAGEEVGESGTPHIQGHIDYSNAKTMKSIQKKLKKFGIALALINYKSPGHIKNGRAYCMKDGKFKTWGEPPSQGKRTDLEGFVAAVKSEKPMTKLQMMEEFPTVYAKYPKFCNEYKLLKTKVATLDHDDKNWPNLWIWGPPGVGKTRRFHDEGDVYCKMPNKWWTGYDGEKTVLLDDFEPQHGVRLGHFLKIWADRYPFTACVHHAVVKIRPARIVITSNWSPEECFSDPRILAAVLRRFKVSKIEKKS